MLCICRNTLLFIFPKSIPCNQLKFLCSTFYWIVLDLLSKIKVKKWLVQDKLLLKWNWDGLIIIYDFLLSVNNFLTDFCRSLAFSRILTILTQLLLILLKNLTYILFCLIALSMGKWRKHYYVSHIIVALPKCFVSVTPDLLLCQLLYHL
jgi:hypothetical protein